MIPSCPHCGCQIVKPRKPKTQPQVSRPPSKPNKRSRMWTVMRFEGVFSAQSVAAVAATELRPARFYINALIAAGYVRVHRATSFEVGDYTDYLLVRNTGPHAPRLRKHGQAIFDCNLKQEVPRVHH